MNKLNTENFCKVNNFSQVERILEEELKYFLTSFEEEYGIIFEKKVLTKILTNIFYRSLTLILDVDDTVIKTCHNISDETNPTGKNIIPTIINHTTCYGLKINIRATDNNVINFITKTISNGVRVIFLSSRDKDSEFDTIKELQALGVENPIVHCIGSTVLSFLVPEISFRQQQILSKDKWAKDNLFFDENRKNNFCVVVDDCGGNLTEFLKFFDHSTIKLLQYTYDCLD